MWYDTQFSFEEREVQRGHTACPAFYQEPSCSFSHPENDRSLHLRSLASFSILLQPSLSPVKLPSPLLSLNIQACSCPRAFALAALLLGMLQALLKLTPPERPCLITHHRTTPHSPSSITTSAYYFCFCFIFLQNLNAA